MIVVIDTAALQYIERPLRCHCAKQKLNCRKRKLTLVFESCSELSKPVSDSYRFQL